MSGLAKKVIKKVIYPMTKLAVFGAVTYHFAEAGLFGDAETALGAALSLHLEGICKSKEYLPFLSELKPEFMKSDCLMVERRSFAQKYNEKVDEACDFLMGLPKYDYKAAFEDMVRQVQDMVIYEN